MPPWNWIAYAPLTSTGGKSKCEAPSIIYGHQANHVQWR